MLISGVTLRSQVILCHAQVSSRVLAAFEVPEEGVEPSPGLPRLDFESNDGSAKALISGSNSCQLTAPESRYRLRTAGGRNSAPCRVAPQFAGRPYIHWLFFFASLQGQWTLLRVVFSILVVSCVVYIVDEACRTRNILPVPFVTFLIQSL